MRLIETDEPSRETMIDEMHEYEYKLELSSTHCEDWSYDKLYNLTMVCAEILNDMEIMGQTKDDVITDIMDRQPDVNSRFQYSESQLRSTSVIELLCIRREIDIKLGYETESFYEIADDIL